MHTLKEEKEGHTCIAKKQRPQTEISEDVRKIQVLRSRPPGVGAIRREDRSKDKKRTEMKAPQRREDGEAEYTKNSRRSTAKHPGRTAEQDRDKEPAREGYKKGDSYRKTGPTVQKTLKQFARVMWRIHSEEAQTRVKSRTSTKTPPEGKECQHSASSSSQKNRKQPGKPKQQNHKGNQYTAWTTCWETYRGGHWRTLRLEDREEACLSLSGRPPRELLSFHETRTRKRREESQPAPRLKDSTSNNHENGQDTCKRSGDGREKTLVRDCERNAPTRDR